MFWEKFDCMHANILYVLSALLTRDIVKKFHIGFFVKSHCSSELIQIAFFWYQWYIHQMLLILAFWDITKHRKAKFFLIPSLPFPFSNRNFGNFAIPSLSRQSSGTWMSTSFADYTPLCVMSSIYVSWSDGGGVEVPPCIKIGYSDPRDQWTSKPVF